jgi:hypothetical protein
MVAYQTVPRGYHCSSVIPTSLSLLFPVLHLHPHPMWVISLSDVTCLPNWEVGVEKTYPSSQP